METNMSSIHEVGPFGGFSEGHQMDRWSDLSAVDRIVSSVHESLVGGLVFVHEVGPQRTRREPSDGHTAQQLKTWETVAKPAGKVVFSIYGVNKLMKFVIKKLFSRMCEWTSYLESG